MPLKTTESEDVLALVRSMEGFVMRQRTGLNPCVVLRFINFMTAVTFAEGADWSEVLERLRLDPRVAAYRATAAAHAAEDETRMEAARTANAARRFKRGYR